MTENAALLAAIFAHPAEDTPRLAYADWFDENGNPARTRFIRLQYQIERLPPTDLKVSKAKKQEDARIVTASDDNPAKVWDARTGAELAAWYSPLPTAPPPRAIER